MSALGDSSLLGEQFLPTRYTKMCFLNAMRKCDIGKQALTAALFPYRTARR